MHMKKAFAQGSSVPPNNIAMSGITLKRDKINMMPNCIKMHLDNHILLRLARGGGQG